MSLESRGDDFDREAVSPRPPVKEPQTAEPSSSRSTVPKRLKACLGCRDLKLRCMRSEEDPDLRCQRCVRARRECIIPAGKTRPKKAGTSAVASLEQKIDALVASLSEIKKDVENGNEQDLRHNANKSSSNETFEMQSNLHRTGLKRGLPEDFDSGQGPSAHPYSRSPETDGQARERIYKDSQNIFSFFMPRPPRTSELFERDVINRGLVSVEDAERVFQRFTKVMLPQFPLIRLDDSTDMSTLRRTKPSFFLAILAAASSILGLEVQKLLAEEITINFADRIIVRGEKDLDLIQAVQVSVMWFFPPEHFDEVKMYQLVHIQTIMAMELGFCQENMPSMSRLPPEGIVGGSLQRNTSVTGTLVERQRTWLVCYFLCGILSMTQRRPSMLQWAPYMDQCMTALESPPDALNSDKLICQFVRGQHIAGEIGQQFCMDDPSAKVDISDVKVQYILRGLEQQVYRWRTQIPPEINCPLLRCNVEVINLYLHEIVIHVGHNINDFKPPFTEESLHASIRGDTPQTRTPMAQNSLVICIMSVKNFLDIFLGLNVETLCSMPMFNLARTAYAVVALIKIHLMALRENDGLFGIIDKEDLKVEFYLDRVLNSMQSAVQQGLRIASIFHLVIEMLRAWFQSQCRAASDNDHSAPEMSCQAQVGWSGNLAVNRNRNIGTPNISSTSGPIISTAMQPSSNDTLSSVFDTRLPLPGTQEAAWPEPDFPGLFYSNDINLFESALGWAGGFV